jgi:hypothetical protein
MMIFATANTNPFVPAYNLSAIYKHYETCTNLCSTTKDTLEICYNLSAVRDLQEVQFSAIPCGTLDALSSNIIHPLFDHTATFGATVQPGRTYNILPSG